MRIDTRDSTGAKNLPWDVIYFSADQGHRKKWNVKFSNVKSQIQNGGGQATGIKCQDFECVCEVKHFPLSQVKHKLSFLLSRNLQLLAPPSGSDTGCYFELGFP